MPSEALQVGILIISAIVPFLIYILKKLFELANHTSHILERIDNLDKRVEQLEKKTSGIASLEQLLENQARLAEKINKIEGFLIRNGFNSNRISRR